MLDMENIINHYLRAQSQAPLSLCMLNLTAKTMYIDLQHVSESLTPFKKIQARPERGLIAILREQYSCFHPAW